MKAEMITVYVSIGNSDDKLTQREWSWFVRDVGETLRKNAKTIHGEWHSASAGSFQNACWCAEFRDRHRADEVKARMQGWAGHYRQDSIAWAEAPHTEFIVGHIRVDL